MIDKDWLFCSDEYICDLRTVGVLVKNNRVLVQREKNGREYALPGGHIKIGETLEAGLVREYKEETGADIKVKRLLWSEECFWEWKGKQAHNIAFYYLTEECNGFEIPDNGEFISHKDNFFERRVVCISHVWFGDFDFYFSVFGMGQGGTKKE